MYADYSAESTWAGDMGDDRAMLFVAHVNKDELYLRSFFWTQYDRDQAVNSLKDNKPAETVLGPRAKKVALADINELRYSAALNLLEIYHGPRNKRFEIQSKRDPVDLWLYAALRERLAPDTKPEMGCVSRAGALSGPVFGLIIALVTVGCSLIVAWGAKPDPHNEGRSAALKDLLERFMYKIGFAGTAAIASIPIICLIGWITYRWRNPPVAEVVKIARPKHGLIGA